MRTKLGTRLAKLEKHPLVREQEDEYLGHVDAAGNIIPKHEMNHDRNFHLVRAIETVLATMSEQHRAHVLDELCSMMAAGSKFNAAQVSNLTRQFYYIISLMVRAGDGDDRRYGLPPAVAQVYLDYPDAVPLDQCGACRYLSPALFAMGRTIDQMPLHSAINAYRFFTKCPLCGDWTGCYAEPYYLWAEFRRVSDLMSVS
jgi:hypothetical protein